MAQRALLHWGFWTHHRVLAANPREWVPMALLARGFPVRVTATGARLDVDALASDPSLGDAALLAEVPGAAPGELGTDITPLAEREAARAQADRILGLGFPLPRGMSGYYDWGGWTNPTFASFMNCAYGRRVPVAVLDPGVAAVVRVLPLIGVDTRFSCDGHGHSGMGPAPVITVSSVFHARWLEGVLRHLFDDDSQSTWEFASDGWILATSARDSETYKTLLWETIGFAEALIGHQDLIERCRRTKSELASPQQLEPTVVSHLLEERGVPGGSLSTSA